MQKTLLQHMQPNAFEKRHYSDTQHIEKRLRVLFEETTSWSDSNVISIGCISELLIDLSNGRCSFEEFSKEIQCFEKHLTNQYSQLHEALNSDN